MSSKRWDVSLHGDRLPSPDELSGCLTGRHPGLTIVDPHGFSSPPQTYYTLEATGAVKAEDIEDVVRACLQVLGTSVKSIIVREPRT